MQARYENWVNGLNGDWCVSRQRFFGVPFPLLVPRARPTARSTIASRLLPTEDQLPIDPSTDVPGRLSRRPARRARRLRRRSRRHGHVGDVVADAVHRRAAGKRDPDLFARTFPMDLRPQAHDIIRTWLFSTVLRSHLEENVLPWANAAISGWVLDPGSQEDVEVQGQRRHADGAARRARLRRGALLGGEGRPRRRHGVRSRPDEGRPPAGHQAAQRVEVRARQDEPVRRR